MNPCDARPGITLDADKTRLRLLLLIAVQLILAAQLTAQPWRGTLRDDETNFYRIRSEFRKYMSGRRFDIRGGEEGKPWVAFKRWEWLMEPRVYPSGELPPPDILHRRMMEYNSAKGGGFVPQGVESGNWTSLGPSVIPASGGVGRINAIAVDPSNTNILWAGAAAGGLWKSTNGGSSWSTTTDAFATLGISAITLDPSNSSTMYIATGDADGLDTYSIGVLKSTDGGASWNPTGLSWTTSAGFSIYSLLADPGNSSILLAAGRQGIYRTTDAGTTWSLVTAGNFKDLAVDPSDPTVWYAAKRSVGVFKSTNTGATFSQLAGGLPASGFTRIAIALAPSLTSTLYALYVNLNDGFYGLYLSTDAGTSWSLESSSPDILSWDGTGTDGQGSYDLVLDVSPADPSTVFAGGINVYKSTSSGSHWTQMTNWYTGTNKPYIHADQHALTFIPGSSTSFLEGNDGGVFLTTNSGSNWADKSAGLTVTEFYRLGQSATDANRVYLGAQDNGTDRYVSGAWSEIIGGDGMTALIDYTNESIGYGEVYYGDIYRTTNGGTSFTEISATIPDTGGWVTPYVMNPSNPKSIYVGDRGVYKSTDRGTSWTTLTGALDPSTLVALAIAPTDSNTLYAGTSSRAWVSTNGGTAWSEITAGLPAAALTYIAVHPSAPATAFATFSGYGNAKVFKTTNFGSTWSNISTGLPSIPANCIAINPANPSGLYLGTDVGVYYSPDGGSSWSSFSTGLPNVIVNELGIHTGAQKIRAATYGRGLWESPLAVQATGSIAGMKFNDIDGNGTKDGADSGLAGWTIHLTSSTPAFSMFDTTDALGDYSFANLPSGLYFVSEVGQAGWSQTDPGGNASYSVGLAIGESSTGNDFGNHLMPVSISGTVFEDLNADTVREGGDPGLAGWKVRISGASADSMLTDGTGKFRFSGIPPGSYAISEDLQANWHRSLPSSGSYNVSLTGGDSAAGKDFGNYRLGSLGGLTFADTNMNGIRDSGEAPIPGWVIHLAGPVAGSMATDSSGNYSFTSLIPGNYAVSESVMAGWVQTVPLNNAPYTISIRSGLDTTGLIFGNRFIADKVYGVLNGWNLLSLPRIVADNHKHAVYPSAISNAFEYAGGYTVVDTLAIGKGFWLKFASEQNIFIDGNAVTSDTVRINPGWNIIGALTSAIPVSAIQQLPGPITSSPYFLYGSLGYQIADSLVPHHGYWVRSGPGGQLVLSGGPASFGSSTSGKTSRTTDGTGTIKLTDNRGREATLYVDPSGAVTEKSPFDLPPVPPDGAFDVRYGNGSILAAYAPGRSEPVPIMISSAVYPLTLKWEMAGATADLSVDQREIPLSGSGSLVLDRAPSRIALKPAQPSSGQLPARFSLGQNYPNPFNPVTDVSFSVGLLSHATLKVYDMLGREVAFLLNGVTAPGTYHVSWDAARFPSGVYTYRLQAVPVGNGSNSVGTFVAEKKMILMK